MAGERDAGTLLEALDRHREDASRMADTLIELERHPGHRLLDAGSPTGETGRRWADAAPAVARLWQDFHLYGDVLARAQTVRERRSRPGQRELDELHELLAEPTIEVARHSIGLHERGLTGDAERIETITLDALATRMHETYQLVGGLVVRCDELSSTMLAALAGPSARVQHLRAGIADLELDPDDPDATAVEDCARRVAELEAAAAQDPLSLEKVAAEPTAAQLDAELAQVTTRLERVRVLHRDWSAVRAELAATVDGLAARRAEVRTIREQAGERVLVTLPELPADRTSELGTALQRLDAVAGWAARESAVDGVRRAAASAAAELDRAHETAAGLLERREELRGRFGAYRARAVRLGRAEDPELLVLGERIESTLWTRPSDLAAATRDLAAYRRRLATDAADPAAADPAADPAAPEEQTG